MIKPKRQSLILETARRRLAGLKQISPKPDFGPTLSVEAYEAEVNGFSNDQDGYVGDVAALNDMTIRLATRERLLGELNQRYLQAVKAHYGPDSSECAQVGGVRSSDRKKPVRPAKPKAA